VAHEGEESRDTKGFVAVADDLEVYRIIVEEDAEPGDDRVYGNHK
jgi:hypothetical protein